MVSPLQFACKRVVLTCAALQLGDNVQVDIVLQRDVEGTDITPVVTSYYPIPKEEVRCCSLWFALALICLPVSPQGWWVVIGDTATDSLLAIKVRIRAHPHVLPLLTSPQRFSFGKSHKVSLSFSPTEAGQKT